MCSLKKSTQWSIHSSGVCCLAQNRSPMARPIRMILSLSLILILLFMWASSPMVTAKALLTELTLVGGGALTLAALLDLLMVTFGASGMDGAVRNQAAATGTQPIPYIGQLLNRYLGTVLDGISPATWAQPIQEGLSYLANGTLYLNAAATAPIADFQRWAWSENGANLYSFAPIKETSDGLLTDANGNQVQILNFPSGLSYGDYTLQLACTGPYNKFYVGTTGSAKIVAYIYRSGGVASRSFIMVAPYSTIPDGTTKGFLVFGNNYREQTTANWNSNSFVQVTGSFNTTGYTLELPISDVLLSSFDSSSWSGDADVVGDENTFVGPMQQGQGTQLPLADVVDVSSGTAARAHLFDYLHAGASAYAGTGVAELPVTDVGTGEDQVLPLNVPLDTPIGVTGVSDGTIAGSGSLAGTDAIAGDFAGTDAYTMDLTQFFPFCIPFDLFALYQKFEAEAAAPVVDWPIPMPGGGDPLTVHLDFSAFDQLAVLVRRLELIAFAVGLMILTKNLIQGGD